MTLLLIGSILVLALLVLGMNFAPPYIPPKDADFASWMENFSDLITANPSLYGLVAADAVTIAGVNATYQSAYTTAVNPATRTGPSVAAKDAAKAAALNVARPYSIQIRNNAGVTNQDKLDLGLTVPDLTPTPIPAPSTSPLLDIVAATPLQHTLRYADQNTPDSRAKPFGATALLLYRSIGVAAAVDPDQADFVGVFTKVPVASNFASGDVGKIATYFGRWATRTGLVGPWSNPVSMGIVG